MKRKIIIGAIILGVVALLVTLNVVKSKNIGVFGGKAIEVKLVDAKVMDLNAMVSVNGKVEEVDKKDIFFDTTVKITSLLIDKDDKVTKGQKMVEFDLDDLYSQLNQAKISLNIQKITLNKIEDSLKLQNTSQAESTLNQASVALEQAKNNFERVETLYNQGAVSYVEYENAKIQYNNIQSQYNIAQNNFEDIKRNNDTLLSTTSKEIKNQNEQIKLTGLKINDLQTKINKLKEQSISPIDGIITELNIQKGSVVNPSQCAIRIINPNYLQVKLDVKEVDILKIKEGQIAQITGDAFWDKKFKGTVKSVGAVAVKKQGISNSDEAFVQVTLSVDNTDKLLKPGLSVMADIITESKKDAVIIPFDAFQEDKNGDKWVFVVENNIAKRKDIVIGISSKLDLEVVSGLLGNEKLVQDPPSRLKDGMKVIIKK